MKTNNKLATEARINRRNRQREGLRQREVDLGRLASSKKKEDFFRQLASLLPTLTSYIKRRLRVAYLTLDIRVSTETTGDILDRVLFSAYENYHRKPPNLTLEQWLYQLANQQLERHIAKLRSQDAHRRSFESLNQAELSRLEELPFTADAEGEPYLVEDLDDSEYHLTDFAPTLPVEHYQEDPGRELERKEEVEMILQALSKVPERERIAFELFAVEGFSKDEVAKITNIPEDEVPTIVQKVRSQVRQELESDNQSRAFDQKT